MTAALSVRGISHSFGATRALSSVDFEVQAGSVHALIGENGAGKSTLMKILSGQILPGQGEMFLFGKPFAPRSPKEARAMGVSIVSQELSLCPHLTVADNIVLGQEPVKWGALHRNQIDEIAKNSLDRLLGEDKPDILKTDALLGELPIAAQQLVEIARALSSAGGGGRVIIFDEPTSALSRPDAERLFQRIDKLRKEGVAIIYISHFLEEIMQVADRYTILRDGGTVAKGDISATTMSDLIEKMAGRRIDELFVDRGKRKENAAGEAVLQCEALRGVSKPLSASLTLHKGEVLGIAGLFGAGRTELFRAIFGLDAVKSGKLVVKALSGPQSPHTRLNQGLGFLSEDRKGEGLSLSMSIADNISLSKLPGRMGMVSGASLLQTAKHWIAELGIKAPDPAQPVSSLSGGNQQKVALARLLHHGVDVLLLDEPTRGIDVASKAQIYALIGDLAFKGCAILVVSSYFPELLGICDRIAVMCKGVLGAAKPVSEWNEHRLLAHATGAVPE